MKRILIVLGIIFVSITGRAQHTLQMDDGLGHYGVFSATGLTMPVTTYTFDPAGGLVPVVPPPGVPAMMWLTNAIGNTLTGGSSITPVERFGSGNNYDVVMMANNVEKLRLVSGGGVSIPGSALAINSLLYTWPGVHGAGTRVLTNDGTGALSWSNAFVSSITGTANQVLANGTFGVPQGGPVTLTTPQDIHTGASPTFSGMTLTGIGGLGVVHSDGGGVLSSSPVVLTSEVSGILPIANGGTNSGAALVGSSIMVSDGSAIIQGATGTANQLLHGDLSWGAVDLTLQVSGVLPIANGGTNSGIALVGSSIMISDGTSIIQGATGTSTQVLHGDLSWSGVAVGDMIPGAANTFLTTDGASVVAWTGFNRNATLVGDGITTALGLDLTNANTWTATQTFADVVINNDLDMTGGNINNANNVDLATISNSGGPSITVNENIIVNGTSTLNGAVTVSGDVSPSAHATYSLGTDAVRWQEAFINGTSLHIGPSGGLAGNTELLVNYDQTFNMASINVDGGTSEIDVTSALTNITNNLDIDGATTLTSFATAGIVHNAAGGLLSTSLIVDADVAAGANVAVNKLAAGANGDVLYTTAGVPTWSSLSSLAVTSLSGTANQVLVNGTSGVPTTGVITLSTPQDINTTSSPTFNNMTINGNLDMTGGDINNIVNLANGAGDVTVNDNLIVTGTTDINTGLGIVHSSATGLLSSSPVVLTSATEVSGILPVANGGTNSGAALVNGRVMTSVGGAIVENAAGTANQLLHGDLSWGAVNLTNQVSNVLPIANGGTNSGTALAGSSIMISNGTQIVQGAAGTATTVLHGNAGGAPTYSAVVSADIQDNTIANADLRQSVALSVIGNSTNAAANVADIAGTTDQVLRVNTAGTVLGFGQIATGGITNNAVTNAKFRQGVARSVVGVTGNATADVADIQGTADQVLRVNGAGTALAFGTIATGGIAPGGTNTFLTTNGASTVAWTGLNINGTLTGNGVGSALGINLTNANTWTGTQTFSAAGNGIIVTTASDLRGNIANSTGNLVLNDAVDVNGDIDMNTNDITDVDDLTFSQAGSVISNSGGSVTVGDAFVVTGTSDLQGNIANSIGNLVLNDAVDVNGNIDMNQNDITDLDDLTFSQGGSQITNTGGDVDVNDDLTISGGILDAQNAANLIGDGTNAEQLEIQGVNGGTAELDLNGDIDISGNTTLSGAGFATAGVIHNAAGGLLSSSLVVSADIATNAVANVDFRQGIARSVVGVTGNATADVADIQGTADQVLRVNTAGTALAFGQIATGGITDDAVTLAKIANAAANSVLVGSGSAGTGTNYTEITLGSNLSMTGTVLNTSGVALSSEPFITFGNSANLSAERSLLVNSTLTSTDGGAGVSVTLGLNLATANTWTNTQSLPATLAQGNNLIASVNAGTAGGINANMIGNGLTDAQVNDNLTISGGTVNNTPVGAVTASTGRFTTITGTALPAASTSTNIVTSNAGALETRTAASLSGLVPVVTNASLTGDGTTGTPLGLNLANANTWTATQSLPATAAQGDNLIASVNAGTTTINTARLNSAVVLETETPTGGDVSGTFATGLLVNSVQNNAVDLTSDVTGLLPDANLATISTAGKVANSATTATSANNPNTIVLRDGAGDFAAGTISANLSGNATTATTATNFSGALAGDVTGNQGTTTVVSVQNAAEATIVAAINSGVNVINAANIDAAIARDNESPTGGDVSGSLSAGYSVNSVQSGAGSSIATAINSANTNDINTTNISTSGGVDGNVLTIVTGVPTWAPSAQTLVYGEVNPAQITGNQSDYNVVTGTGTFYRLDANAANYTIDGIDASALSSGRVITLVNTSANDIIITDEGSSTYPFMLNGAVEGFGSGTDHVTLGQNGMITFIWDGTSGFWRQMP
jgi:hypothetical protein